MGILQWLVTFVASFFTGLVLVLAFFVMIAVAGCGIIRDPAAPDDGSVRTSTSVTGVNTATVTIHILLPWDTVPRK
jgi:hypothetical protein